MTRNIKRFIGFCAVLMVVSITACGKKQNTVSSLGDFTNTIKLGKLFGYVLLDGQSLWSYDETKEASKQWEWLLAMTAGKKVELIESEPTKIKKDNDELEWYHIRCNDKEGYATKYYIGTFNTLAVVTADGAMRFKSPEITGVIAAQLYQKEL